MGVMLTFPFSEANIKAAQIMRRGRYPSGFQSVRAIPIYAYHEMFLGHALLHRDNFARLPPVTIQPVKQKSMNNPNRFYGGLRAWRVRPVEGGSGQVECKKVHCPCGAAQVARTSIGRLGIGEPGRYDEGRAAFAKAVPTAPLGPPAMAGGAVAAFPAINLCSRREVPDRR